VSTFAYLDAWHFLKYYDNSFLKCYDNSIVKLLITSLHKTLVSLLFLSPLRLRVSQKGGNKINYTMQYFSVHT
jgi:hypothetical protein